jgi:hypothetical protein
MPNLSPTRIKAYIPYILNFTVLLIAIFQIKHDNAAQLASLQKDQIQPYIDKQIALMKQSLHPTLRSSDSEATSNGFTNLLDPMALIGKTTPLNTTAQTAQQTVVTQTITTYTASISGLPSADNGSLLYRASGEWTTGNGLYHGGSTFGIGTTSPEAKLHIVTGGTDTTGFIVQGASGQSAFLQKWQNSGGTTLASINSQGKLTIASPADDHSIELTPTGNAGYLSSSGGAIFLNNTSNLGTGLGIYSNAGADALGNMINIKVDNALYDQAAFYMNYDGASNAVEIVSNSTDTSANALSVTNNNPNDSAVGIIGYETGRGTLKVSHNGTGTDANASALSIDLKGSGTKAQGVYVDSTAATGTTGNLLRLRNQSVDKFVVNYQGNLSYAGDYTQGANGTDTTFTKYGNIAGDEFYVGTTGAFRVQRSATNSEAFRVQVSGDTQGRWLGTSDGRLKWGDGSTAQDIVLQRGAANLLYLDGGIIINNSAIDIDTVIKGDTDTNLFYVDATTDQIGIGISTPTTKLDVASSSAGVINMLRLASTATATNNYGSALVFAAKRTTSGTTNIANISGIITDITQAAYKGALLFSTSNNAAPSERMRIDNSGNIGIGVTSFGTNAAKVLAIGNGTAPSTSIADGIQLYAEDTASSSELKVRDEAGNATTLSPHNFSLIPEGASEPLAWSYYSERDGQAINVDLTKTVRIVEQLSGQQLVHVKNLFTGEDLSNQGFDLPSPLSPTSTQLPQSPDISSHISLTDTAITILKELIVKTTTVFHNTVSFFASAIFHEDVIFEKGLSVKGKFVLNGDHVGQATMTQGQTTIIIPFPHPFDKTPIITVSQDAFIKGSYRLQKSTNDFRIELSEPQDHDVTFDWHAFSGYNATTTQTNTASQAIAPTASLSPQPSPDLTSTPQTIVLSASNSATASNSAQ